MNLLERLRVDRGLTQQQVADTAGVSRATVIRAEAGGGLHAATAKALGDFYGMTASDLIAAMREEAQAA